MYWMPSSRSSTGLEKTLTAPPKPNVALLSKVGAAGTAARGVVELPVTLSAPKSETYPARAGAASSPKPSAKSSPSRFMVPEHRRGGRRRQGEVRLTLLVHFSDARVRSPDSQARLSTGN